MLHEGNMINYGNFIDKIKKEHWDRIAAAVQNVEQLCKTPDKLNNVHELVDLMKQHHLPMGTVFPTIDLTDAGVTKRENWDIPLHRIENVLEIIKMDAFKRSNLDEKRALLEAQTLRKSSRGGLRSNGDAAVSTKDFLALLEEAKQK
jgi:hypothetical protein